jgi:hypothetical protein
MTKLALCQGCLRVHRVCDLVPDDNDPPGLCPICAGQTCSCRDCIASIDALARGNSALPGAACIGLLEPAADTQH